MPLDTKQYAGMEVRKNFVNRPDFGFLPLDVNPGGGCVYGIDKMHQHYLSVKTPEKECRIIDGHVLECTRCRDSWDARMSDLRDWMNKTTRDGYYGE